MSELNTPLDTLIASHYDDLRRLAHAYLRRERLPNTLQTTGLVNEAYIRLSRIAELGSEQRTRFFAVMSNTMRRIIVDHARNRRRLKRGGGAVPIALDDIEDLISDAEAEEFIALDEALTILERVNPRGSAVVQHRFFGGLTLEDTALLLGISVKTVQRDWITARAWLRKEVPQRNDG